MAISPLTRDTKEESNLSESSVSMTTEEEVNALKKELAQKEKELEALKSSEKDNNTAIVEKSREKEINLEKEKIETSVDISGKMKKSSASKKSIKISKIKQDDLAEDLKMIMDMDKPRQIKTLVYLAFKKGVNYAANIASQLKDPYMLDEFHDTLVDHLYDLLKKKKKI